MTTRATNDSDDLAAIRLMPGRTDPQRFVLGRLRQAVEAAIVGHRLAVAGRTIVDIGAGAKPYEPLFAPANYVGCDLDHDADVVFTPGERIDLADAQADAVVSFQVLEHVWDLDWYLGEAHRLLKDEGVLLLSTHGNWPYHPHPTDFRRWTRAGLVREIETRGFRVDEVTAVGGPIVYGTLLRQLAIRRVVGRIPVVGGAMSSLIGAVFNLRLVIEDAITPGQLSEENAIVYLVQARPIAADRDGGGNPA